MSGIAALIHYNGKPADPPAIKRMTGGMAYRGPDGIRHWSEDNAALGHCLLRTTQAHESPQPLVHDQSGVSLVFDGFLANWEELKTSLVAKGATIRNGDDVELVLHAYLAWGQDAACHLDGEFACVIWDRQKQRCLSLRDHHGLRPLYYHWDGHTLLVASEIAAILEAMDTRPSLNMGYVAEQAADVSFSSDQTVWKGIYRLLPAHVLSCANAGLSVNEYWTLPIGVETPFRSDGEYIEAYQEMFFDCVRRCARTHKPIACEVSGGLDSSAVFAAAHSLSKCGQLPSPEARAYTLAGPAGTEADEVRFAREIGDHLNAVVHEHPLYMPDLNWFADFAARDRDMPPLPNAAMSLNLDRAAASDGCRTILTGIGGDQWLDGSYHYYRELFVAQDWARYFNQYREDVRSMGLKQATALMLRLGPGSLLPVSLRHLVRNKTRGRRAISKGRFGWLRSEFRQEVINREQQYEARFAREYRDSYKLRKLKYPRWAQILDSAGRQRARTGLEMRSPMMARAFIEFSTTTPEHIKLRGDLGKYIHRNAMQDYLPPEVTWRNSKAEFSTVYFRLEEEMQEQVSAAKKLADQLLDPAETDALFEDYMTSMIDERYTGEIWGIYVSVILLRLDAQRREKGTD